MKVWAMGAAFCLVGSVAQAQSPIIGKWCSKISNGMRILTIDKIR
jgi:hypothetical protein